MEKQSCTLYSICILYYTILYYLCTRTLLECGNRILKPWGCTSTCTTYWCRKSERVSAEAEECEAARVEVGKRARGDALEPALQPSCIALDDHWRASSTTSALHQRYTSIIGYMRLIYEYVRIRELCVLYRNIKFSIESRQFI